MPLGMVYRWKVVLTGASNLASGFWPLVEKGRLPSHQLPVNTGSMFGPSHLSVRPKGALHLSLLGHYDSMVSHINRQGGLSLWHLFVLAERLLRWAQLNFRSLRAMHVPGKLNMGADMLSRSNVPSDKWTFHRQTVQEIWGIFGRPEVDLFASEDNTH